MLMSCIDARMESSALNESDLISCAVYLQELIKTCQGDVPKLRDQMLEDYRSKKYARPVFQKVLDDNIAACKQAAYVNKEKVLNFLKSCLQSEPESRAAPEAGSSHAQNKTIDEVRETLSTHHAPKFVDDEVDGGIHSPTTSE